MFVQYFATLTKIKNIMILKTTYCMPGALLFVTESCFQSNISINLTLRNCEKF